MRVKAVIISCFLLVSLQGESQVLPSFGNSRTGTAGMQFLKILPDARGNALAGSYVAIADDATSMFWNPAGITLAGSQNRWNIASSYTAYFGGFNLAAASAVYKAKGDHFWGLYTYALNSPEMMETTELQPFGTGRTFKSSSSIVGMSYGKVLTNSFSFGVNAKYGREAYADVAVNNVMFDLGLHYNVGIKNARFAVTLSNFGINVKPQGKVTILKHNAEETIEDFERVSVPAIFRIGAAFDPIDKENHKLTLSAQLNHPTDNNETLAFGIEYLIRRTVYVRTGYEFGQDVSSLPPLGIGYRLPRKFGKMQLDYTYQHQASLGSVHRLTFGIALK
ncbi:MAG: PorV/PorQ family protein [Bacteroidetes bacterium]|nr:MAG: PorV/PorQ family protein [Bacteroidota bacterium]